MAVRCGDCGAETAVTGSVRTCPVCGTSTTLTGRLSRGPRLQNIPIRIPEGRRIQDAFAPKAPPIAADYATIEQRMKYSGGGVQGACHRCGNAFEECECS